MKLATSSPFASEQKLFTFFVSLVLLFVLYPVLEQRPLFLHTIVSILFCSIVYTLASDKRHFLWALCFAVPSVLLNLIDAVAEHHLLTSFNLLLTVVFYAYVAFTILRYVLSAKKVSRYLIFGAISVYLLIGIIFGLLYLFVEQQNSPAFTVSTGEPFTVSTSFYYSFTTLTTVGYGDVLPRTVEARSVAMLEMVTGVLFVAITIARVVSAYRPSTEKRS